MWQAWHRFGANQNALCFSFRCRSPGAHVARYFFTLLLPLTSAKRAAGPQGPTKEAHPDKKRTSFRMSFLAFAHSQKFALGLEPGEELVQGREEEQHDEKLNAQWRLSKGMPVTHQEKASCQPPRKSRAARREGRSPAEKNAAVTAQNRALRSRRPRSVTMAQRIVHTYRYMNHHKPKP